MEMPRPTEAHHRLERLVGSWQGEERLFPSPWDPQGGPAVGRVENRLALDGFAVIQDYEQERHGEVTFRGHGIFRWDAGRSLYVFHWFDSLGQPPSEFHGAFDGDVLTLVSPMPQGHSRAVFDLSHDGRYHYRMDVSPDAEHWHPFMEGEYVRIGQASSPRSAGGSSTKPGSASRSSHDAGAARASHPRRGRRKEDGRGNSESPS